MFNIFRKKEKFYGNQFVKMGTYKIVRRKRSFWGRVLDQIKNFFRKLGIAVLLVMIAWAVVEVIHYAYPNITYKIVEKEVVLDSLEKKIDQLKGELIDDIWNTERNGKGEEDGLITWDPNKTNSKVEIASIGTCQYKVSTMQEKWKQYYGEDLTRKQAILKALDDGECKKLMADIIFSEKDGWRNWWTTCNKVNCVKRLEVINELQK